MTTDVYNQKNNKVGTVDLPDKVFKVRWNPELVNQVLLSQLSNRRKPIAHAKGRSEVRGGGAKPWRQKHTGRARAGSIRSPLWKGGGVTHGPTKERIFAKKINKKMKRLALCSILSKKLTDKEIKVISDFTLADHKTKNVSSFLKNFFESSKPSILFIPIKGNKNLFWAARNIAKAKVLSPDSLNTYDCLNHKYIFLEKDAIGELTKAHA